MGGFAQRFGVAMAVATVLFAASCGSGDGDESPVAAGDEEPTAEVANDASTTSEPEQTTAPETSTTVQPATTTTLVSVDPEEWVNIVNELLSDRRYRGTIASIRYIVPQQEGNIYHITLDAIFWRDLGATHSTFAEVLPQAPEEFAELNQAFKQANLALAEHWAVAADNLEADAKAEALENEEVPEDWQTYIDTNADAEEAVGTACFALRDAVIDSGFGLINCVDGDDGSEFEPRTLEDCLLLQRLVESQPCGGEPEDDGDAATVELGESELAAGATYTFDAFARPFVLTFDEPTVVSVGSSKVTIAPVDNDLWSMFSIFALDELVEPATMKDNGNGSLIDMPDDFAGWVESLPFAVASEGQSIFGGTTVPYWRLEAPVERDSPDAFEFYNFAQSDGQLARDGIFWLLPHPDGPLVVYTFPFGDEPLGRTADEKFAYVEATLRTLELIASS